jgi:hypothetical protein
MMVRMHTVAMTSAPRPQVRIGFTGFWDDFDPRHNFLTRLLSSRYDVVVCDRPDYLIHSCIGRRRHDHRREPCGPDRVHPGHAHHCHDQRHDGGDCGDCGGKTGGVCKTQREPFGAATAGRS